MRTTTDRTIGDIVAEDYRAAAVFQQYGIDFWMSDVDAACAAADPAAPRFAEWDPAALADYIVTKHHAYVRRALPAIAAYARKLSSVHGPNHPELLDVERIFADVAAEMTSHMAKEEQMLFPFIVSLANAAASDGRAPIPPFGTVANPIRMMEHEHDSAGGAMARIRALTRGFAPPDDACATYRVALQELEAFEQDLHEHVHLENNILFPKALRLEAALQ
jgi:regulator of cell morphogenesis and NO signaling